MTKWKHKINIKQHLSDDTSWEGMTVSANNIAKELRRLPDEMFECYGFEDDIMFLEGVNETDHEVYECEEDLLDKINYRLGSIYDFADINKIWLGL